MFQVQNAESNSIEHDSNSKYQKTNPNGGLGIEFGPLASLFGNLISSNPQMMLSMVQNFLQDNGSGFNFDSITSMITEKLDMDTLMSMASAFGLSSTRSGNTRGEKDEASVRYYFHCLYFLHFLIRNYLTNPNETTIYEIEYHKRNSSG